MEMKKKRARRRFRKAINLLYGVPDRQEELLDIICEAFLREQRDRENGRSY